MIAAFVAYGLIIGSIGIITKLPEGWSTAAAIAVPLVVVPLVLVLFNKGMLRRLIMGHEKYVQYELQKGRAVRKTYHVLRALSFDDLRTSCMTHYLELNDGSVMCLYGQYLYEYEPIDDDPELNQPRLFPTSEFSAVRLIRNDELLDFEIGGEVVATKLVEEPDDHDAIADLGFKLHDGEIAESLSFGEVKAVFAPKPT